MLDPIVPTLLTAAIGAGIFVRLVAKEKYRRERHLQFRLDEQVRKINEARDLAKKKAEEAEQAKQANRELMESAKATVMPMDAAAPSAS